MSGEWEWVYGTSKFQVLHCMYSWKKTWRAMAGEGAVLDGYLYVADDLSWANVEYTPGGTVVSKGWCYYRPRKKKTKKPLKKGKKSR